MKRFFGLLECAGLIALLAAAGGGLAAASEVGLRVWPDRFIYSPGGTGTVRVTLEAVGTTPIEGRLVVLERSGLDDERPLAARDVRFEASAADVRNKPIVLEFPYNASDLEGGRAFEASFAVGGKRVAVGREYGLVTNNPVRMSHLVFLTAFGREVMDAERDADGGGAEHVRGIRAAYAGVYEQFCYAPDDFALHAPDFDRWYSGQTMYPMSKRALQARIDEAHRQGMVALAYATKWVYGAHGFELARRHPDWFYWDSNWYGSVWNVKTLKRWFLPISSEEQAKLGQPGLMSITPLVTLPEVADHGIDQLRRSMRMFGFDGVRFDSNGWDTSIVRNPDPANAFGRKAYPDDCQDPDRLGERLVNRMRGELAAEFPRFIYGDNVGWGWAADLAKAPRKVLAEARAGGLIMEEGFNGWVHPQGGAAAEWSALLDYFTALPLNIRRAGGYPYIIGIAGAPGDNVADGRTLAALAFACGAHACFKAADYLLDYMRFNVRHAELLYDENLAAVENPAERGLAVKAAGPVWWEPLVRARTLPGGQGQILMHLINAPRHGRFNETEPVRDDLPALDPGSTLDAPPEDLDALSQSDAPPVASAEPETAPGAAVGALQATGTRSPSDAADARPFAVERAGIWRLDPPAASEQRGAMQAPPVQGNLRVMLGRKAGLRVKRAFLLSPDAGVPEGELPLTQTDAGVQVTVPYLSLWSLLVFEGEATPELPRHRTFEAPTTPECVSRRALSPPASEPAAAEALQQVWRYWPGENLENRFTNHDPSLVAPEVAPDPAASAGKAVLLKPGQRFNWRMASLPPGRYRLDFRAKVEKPEIEMAFMLDAHHVVSLADESNRSTDGWLDVRGDAFGAVNEYRDFSAEIVVRPPWHPVFVRGRNHGAGRLWIAKLELTCLERTPLPEPLRSWRVEAAGDTDRDAGDGQVAPMPDWGASIESGILPPGRYRVASRVKRTGRGQDNVFAHVGGYGGGFLGLQASSFTSGAFEDVVRHEELLQHGSIGTRCSGMPDMVLDRMDVHLVERFTESQSLEKARAPRSERKLLPRPGLQVWLAEGLFAREAGLLDALRAVDAEVTAAWLSSHHGSYRLEGDIPRKFLQVGQDADIEDILATLDEPAGLDELPESPLPPPAVPGAGEPAFEQRLMAYDLAILHDVPATTLDLAQRALIHDFVMAGGGLLVTGGMFGLDRGGYQESDLLSELLPVTLADEPTLGLLVKPEPLAAGAEALLARSLDVGASPVVSWLHKTTTRSGATVELVAGGVPTLVTWRVGKGRVAVLTAPPYGDPSAGQPGYWDWPGWPKLMSRLLAWLAREEE